MRYGLEVECLTLQRSCVEGVDPSVALGGSNTFRRRVWGEIIRSLEECSQDGLWDLSLSLFLSALVSDP